MKTLKNKKNIVITLLLVASLFLVATTTANVHLAGDTPDGSYPDSVKISPDGDIPDGSYPDSVSGSTEGDIPDGNYPD